MKIAFNLKEINSSFGGGNNFIISFKKFLISSGHQVVHTLNDKDIDIILILDPRYKHQLKSITIKKIINYALNIKRDVLIVQRINECDERKKTKYINRILKTTNYLADHTIFIASWLKNLNLWQKNEHNSSIILNGADYNIFNQDNKTYSNLLVDKLKIVTHHWSDNFYKGLDIYQKLDNLISSEKWKNKITFSYIGQPPRNNKFLNTSIHDPLSGKKLSNELKKNDAYISGSINEPAGMHHIEGCMCGLPILYRNSGALPEYCKNYGIEIDEDNIENSINKLIDNFEEYKKRISHYPNNSTKMSKEYIRVFEILIKNKKSIIEKRNFYKNPFLLFFNKYNYFI